MRWSAMGGGGGGEPADFTELERAACDGAPDELDECVSAKGAECADRASRPSMISAQRGGASRREEARAFLEGRDI